MAHILNKVNELHGKELRDFLISHKKEFIQAKKSALKHTDILVTQPFIFNKKSTNSFKANTPDPSIDGETLLVKVIANAAWWCDSQMDVLTETCYDKSIKEKGIRIPHIEDHIHKSTSHVGDVQAIYTQKVFLKDLNIVNKSGNTTALIFETLIRKDYNDKVYLFYKNGKINQHSIGLIYVQLILCINDSKYTQEYADWQKHYSKVINKEVIDEHGYFWLVSEIKIMENSCVLFGSNELTETLETSNNKKMTNKLECPYCESEITEIPDDGNCPECGEEIELSCGKPKSNEPDKRSTQKKPTEKSLNFNSIAESLQNVI